MAKKLVTSEQQKKIQQLAWAANKRIRRAEEGQRRAIEFYNRGDLNKSGYFSTASAKLTYAEANRKIKALQEFMAAESTTKTGWRELKESQVRKANETWQQRGYNLTDSELAEILKQVDASEPDMYRDYTDEQLSNLLIQQKERRKKKYYMAVDLVQAAHEDDKWEGSAEDIKAAIAEALDESGDAQEALIRSIQVRNAKR